VLRFVQVGTMVVADRYMYFPSVGLCMLIGIGLERWWAQPPARWSRPAVRGGLVVATSVIGLAMMIVTWRQVNTWKNSESLWRYTLKYNPTTPQGHNNLGIFLQMSNRPGSKDQAMDHFRQAIEVEPDYAEAHTNLANLLQERGQTDQAVQHYQIALKAQPNHVFANMNLANVLAQRGQLRKAEEMYRRVLEMEPRLAPAHLNLGHTLYQMKRIPEALTHYEIAYEQKPEDYRLCVRIADLYYATQQIDKAIQVAQGGLARAETSGQTQWAGAIRQRLIQYQTRGQAPRPQVN